MCIRDRAEGVNEHLFEDLSRSELFITFFLASYDIKRKSLTYCSAGHNPPLLYRAEKCGDVQRLEAAGVPTGILPEFSFEERTIGLKTGDVLVLYTDGITEAKNSEGDFFGEERLRGVIDAQAGSTAQQLLDAVIHAVEDHQGAGKSDDDQTVIVMKVTD